ncbi:FHA domain-containing protein [Prosthecodimorpha staleyi]|uniref:FHA domain-containing protein n=1 Tax=Prosthecodimorpha staleyi TaxID=2840188 RepID=A0A947D6V6_9HYPH|nr:FHA domain-containing protein [Prosthecodimorpha staleyi]MBT9292021.1 FHA domain-containing protein [Prosthecodimorpha staleyi]
MSRFNDPEEDRTRVVGTRPGEEEALRLEGDLDAVETQLVMRRSNNPMARLVVIDGHGLGNAKPIYPGTNSIGRDRKNRVALDFGDDTISRIDHAIIVCDDRSLNFRIYDGGKLNPVHVNSVLVTGERELSIGDVIELGSTLLRLEAV